jgi:hypothetical protein
VSLCFFFLFVFAFSQGLFLLLYFGFCFCFAFSFGFRYASENPRSRAALIGVCLFAKAKHANLRPTREFRRRPLRIANCELRGNGQAKVRWRLEEKHDESYCVVNFIDSKNRGHCFARNSMDCPSGGSGSLICLAC